MKKAIVFIIATILLFMFGGCTPSDEDAAPMEAELADGITITLNENWREPTMDERIEYGLNSDNLGSFDGRNEVAYIHDSTGEIIEYVSQSKSSIAGVTDDGFEMEEHSFNEDYDNNTVDGWDVYNKEEMKLGGFDFVRYELLSDDGNTYSTLYYSEFDGILHSLTIYAGSQDRLDEIMNTVESDFVYDEDWRDNI
ncbi:MAG: hypothetical protein MSA09_00445 [Lachnospiraceae bacterium]|nr:hypothetical protein [Lachnospiraceae bacterium]